MIEVQCSLDMINMLVEFDGSDNQVVCIQNCVLYIVVVSQVASFRGHPQIVN